MTSGLPDAVGYSDPSTTEHPPNMIAYTKRARQRVNAIAFLLLAASPLLFALQGFGSSASSSASKVVVSTKVSLDPVAAGSSLKVAVLLEIHEGWHINSNTPTHDYL